MTKLEIQIKVIANSSRSLIQKGEGVYLKVYLRSPREKGRANRELIELFQKTFHPTKFDLEIVSGKLLPKKRLQLTFQTQSAYQAFLEKLTQLMSES